MIVPMRHLDLVCVAQERETALAHLREMGIVHLDLSGASSAEVTAARGELEAAERAVRLILRARETADDVPVRPRGVSDVLALDADRATLVAEADRLEREIRLYEPYGDFDPELAQRLLDCGVDFSGVAELPAKLPAMRLSRMVEKLERVRNRVAIDTARIAGCDAEAIVRRYPDLADRIAFAAAKEKLADRGAVAVVTGWVPATLENRLITAARESGWGVLMRAPEAGENPPTLIQPPKLFRPVRALFEGLGVAPGYTEADVSVPFMCYFSVFFAMLVGDGAYGLIFLLATLWGWFRFGRDRAARSWLVLLTVFSLATVVWGALSNTWFGAGIPACADWPTVRWLADPSYHTMMFLCFTIGASHLMLARLWNAVSTLNSTVCLAQLGWAGVLLCMYWVTCGIVGIFQGPVDAAALAALPEAARTLAWIPRTPGWFFPTFGVSVALVFLFSVPVRELKARGAELGMLPLSIMSALGDIISYVRLFAVGLASVKVAENFNSMATSLVAGADAAWLKALMALAMVLILVVGHALNLAMAGLSILVHAVRLNTLEFSNHKGVSWAGYAFSPFRRKGSRG